MGLRGFPKKPTALERAEGFPGHRNPSDHEPVFVEGEPQMPQGLSGPARKVWRETVTILMQVSGLLTEADGSVLADYCVVNARKHSLEKEIRLQEQALATLTRAKERDHAKTLIEQAKAQGKKLAVAEAAAMAMAAVMKGADDKLSALQSSLKRTSGEWYKLLHRENVLRREIGLSASARSSIRLGNPQNEKQDAEDTATFGRRPRLERIG